MRNKVAKRIKKSIYGDLSVRVKTYVRQSHRIYKTKKGEDGKVEMYFVNRDTIICASPRRDYLMAKAAYKRRAR